MKRQQKKKSKRNRESKDNVALVLEQKFRFGRFHATRWNQSPFEDPFGEWPPSPWRLLRAVASRWFQYARETGDEEVGTLKELLQTLAHCQPAFYLPPHSWRGPAIKQYQPTGFEIQHKYKTDPNTNKTVPDYQYRDVTRTLVEDHYRLVAPEAAVLWYWQDLQLTQPQEVLLDGLLERILYFGRAESRCQVRRLHALPRDIQLNCTLSSKLSRESVPVLAPLPGRPLEFEVLLSPTDCLQELPIPPGTAWYYAKLPRRPPLSSPRNEPMPYPANLHYVQFVLGGRVYPPPGHWIKITERVRGRVLKALAKQLTRRAVADYSLLAKHERDQLKLIAGKDGTGTPLRGHAHAFFLLWPDEYDLPTRLIAWRAGHPFSPQEIEALLRAAEKPVSWEAGAPNWSVRLVPLPFSTPLPKGFRDPSRTWVSATPFVTPAGRHRFRKNGAERQREGPNQLLLRLLHSSGAPQPENIAVEGQQFSWVRLHETHERRRNRQETRTPLVRPGYKIRLKFSDPVPGPIILGDSCHFGLGLFRSVPD